MLNDLAELLTEDRKNADFGDPADYVIDDTWNLILKFPAPVLTQRDIQAILKKEKILF